MMTMEDIHDRAIGFIGGNAMTMFSGIVTGAEAGKVLILGLLGGLAGMLAKDIYKFIKDKIFFDIGANVGMYSIYAAMISKVKVYSFEPESNNFNALIENIISNNLMSVINAYPIAISDTSGFTSLYLSTFETGSSHHMVDKKLDHNLKKVAYKNKQGVFKSSLDEIIHNWQFPVPNYLKIDVDGIENIIVKNSTFLLKSVELESILIEINRNRDEDTEIISILEKKG